MTALLPPNLFAPGTSPVKGSQAYLTATKGGTNTSGSQPKPTNIFDAQYWADRNAAQYDLDQQSIPLNSELASLRYKGADGMTVFDRMRKLMQSQYTQDRAHSRVNAAQRGLFKSGWRQAENENAARAYFQQADDLDSQVGTRRISQLGTQLDAMKASFADQLANLAQAAEWRRIERGGLY